MQFLALSTYWFVVILLFVSSQIIVMACREFEMGRVRLLCQFRQSFCTHICILFPPSNQQHTVCTTFYSIAKDFLYFLPRIHSSVLMLKVVYPWRFSSICFERCVSPACVWMSVKKQFQKPWANFNWSTFKLSLNCNWWFKMFAFLYVHSFHTIILPSEIQVFN